ncbi:MAG: hypothetical protein EPN86_03360 [Nanoarchaeota archaeon]|nr:MAG: hypothetical protein EPN86_03360 [Nanoarchaeota archaeon]
MTPKTPQKSDPKIGTAEMIYLSIIGILVIVLILGVSRKVTEPFTEVYLNDFNSLPKFANGSVSFSFSIHNSEGVDAPYAVEYKVEYFSYLNQKVADGFTNSEIITVPKGEIVAEKKTFPLKPAFELARITVTLPQKDQKIHFWVQYTGNRIVYRGYGNVSVECLEPLDISGTDWNLVVHAHAVYGNGWPDVMVLQNGNWLGNFTVDSNLTEPYTVKLTPNQQSIIEIIYGNDYYNETPDGQVIDRNLYIDAVNIGDTHIPQESFIIEPGLPSEWFDCQKTRITYGAMTSPASFRLRLLAPNYKENVTTQ